MQHLMKLNYLNNSPNSLFQKILQKKTIGGIYKCKHGLLQELQVA